MDDTTGSSKKSKRVRIAIVCIVVAIALWVVAALAQGPVASLVNTGDASGIMSSGMSSDSYDGWGSSGGTTSHGSSGSSSSGSSSSGSYGSYGSSSTTYDDGDVTVTDPIVARKVDRGAELGIVASDFERATVALDELLAAADARIESDETTQYGRTERNAGYLSRVIYARVPSEGLNDFIAAVSDSTYLEISSRHVSMRDVTEEYTEMKGKIDDLNSQIDETNAKLGQEGLTEAEKSRLESDLARLEEHRESAKMQVDDIEKMADMAEVSIVLQGRAKQASADVTQKQQELSDKLAETPAVLANVFMTIIIVLLTVLPHVIICGIIGLAAWFVWSKVSASKNGRDAEKDE